jgi:serine/threonine protein kinase
LLEHGLTFSDLKPDNIVLVRYQNKDESEFTLYQPCYKIKLIDLGSITIIENIDSLNIKKDKVYPKVFSPFYTK